MKALFIALLMIAGIFNWQAAQAQSAIRFPTIAGDTVVNTGTVNKTFSSTGATRGVVVQTNLTKISGTGAGTVGVYESLDGVNYKLIGSASTITDVTNQSFIFFLTVPIARYIRTTYTGSGTESMATVTYYKIAE